MDRIGWQTRTNTRLNTDSDLGVVLDFDLACKRSLGPLRRFDFVAPAAHPTGFSIGMLLASPNNTFVGELVRNLPVYNRYWFFLPYVAVMFSTGCHYASYVPRPSLSTTSFLGADRNPYQHFIYPTTPSDSSSNPCRNEYSSSTTHAEWICRYPPVSPPGHVVMA